MNPPADQMVLSGVAAGGQVAVVYCNQSFTFEAGHRMRAARCLVCGYLIGDSPAAVIGAAALVDEACDCGGIVTDAWLIHASHTPMEPDALKSVIRRGLECPHIH